MVKIVIVDDEPRHRKGLANFIGKIRPTYEINQSSLIVVGLFSFMASWNEGIKYYNKLIFN